MPNDQPDLIGTIEAIHAAGIDSTLWPGALAAMTRCVGGIGATIERYDRRISTIKEFLSFGIPPANELAYLADYAVNNARVPAILRSRPGEPVWDYLVLDENAMRRDPFYADFLAPVGFRYFIGARLADFEDERTLVSVQRASRQGHAEPINIKTFRRLLPHVRQAVDVARRLEVVGDARRSLEHAMDWLADAVLLLRDDGTVLYANEAFQILLRKNDGIRVRKGRIEWSAPEAQLKFAAALQSVTRGLRDAKPQFTDTDFAAAKPSGDPPYLVSVRPVLGKRQGSTMETAADAIVFVRDPTVGHDTTTRILREVFGFTAAEANLAQALQSGVSMNDYALSRAVRMTTVYTHLRRIKEKTGCHRMPELIRKLNEAYVPLRPA